MRRSGRRATALVAAIAVATPACSFARSGEQRQADPPARARVGDEALLAGATTTTSTPGAEGAPAPALPAPGRPGAEATDVAAAGFAVAIRSRVGVPQPGVPVTVTGSAQQRLVTGPDGVARFTGAPGRYVATVESGCTDDVQVQTGASARIDVPEGEIVEGRLTVEARRRTFPAGPVTYEARQKTAETEGSGRQWKVGTAYVVRYTLVDRCTGRPAPGGRIGDLAFPEPFPLEIQVQDRPEAGPDGVALLIATCRDVADEVALTVADRRQPDDRVDLFSRALLDDTAPSCVR